MKFYVLKNWLDMNGIYRNYFGIETKNQTYEIFSMKTETYNKIVNFFKKG